MSFKYIIGHKSAKKILQKQIKSSRVSHAYLFTGREGIGKKTLAIQFAKALFCRQIVSDSCDSCITCRKIEHYNHPDLKSIEIEEDSKQLKIDQIREMQRTLAYKPYEGERKVYIIDDADHMTSQAANSLLKTLEEPPSYATIILLAEDINKILPTVFSRCQHIKLSAISKSKIKDLLIDKGIKKDKIEILSRLANGSPGQALRLSSEEGLFSQREEVLSFLIKLQKIDSVKLFEFVDIMVKLYKQGFPLFDLLSNWYHDIMMYKQDSESNDIINYDYRKNIIEEVNSYNINELISILNLINKYQQYIDHNVRKDLVLQVLLLKIRNKRV